jgi:hypothetical protein
MGLPSVVPADGAREGAVAVDTGRGSEAVGRAVIGHHRRNRDPLLAVLGVRL